MQIEGDDNVGNLFGKNVAWASDLKTKPINNQPKVESENQKLTRVYAGHVLSGLCTQEYMTRFENLSWSAAQRSSKWKEFQKGCRCLSTEILSVVEPYELVDFARISFAEPVQKSSAPVNQTRMMAISNLYYSPLLLKKCLLPE